MKSEKKSFLKGYDLWLKNLIGERELFEELTDEEIYKIILKISEITFNRGIFFADGSTFEDIADEIYRNYLIRDYEKNLEVLSDVKTEEFPYYDEKSRKYFSSWRPRSEKKGFDRMRERKMTIIHFSNLIYREIKNCAVWHTRDNYFKISQNSISLDDTLYEGENSVLSSIEDIRQTRGLDNTLIENYISELVDDMKDTSELSNYFITINRQTKVLSYGNLLELYKYLDKGKRVVANEIFEHIIYKEDDLVERVASNNSHLRKVGNFIASFRKYLIDSKIVNFSTYKDKGREIKRYGFVK